MSKYRLLLFLSVFFISYIKIFSCAENSEEFHLKSKDNSCCLATKSQFVSFDDSTPLQVFLKQIELSYKESDFLPRCKGYDKTDVSCKIVLNGVTLPASDYELIFYDGIPLFLKFFNKTVLPLYWLNIPYKSQGMSVDEKNKIISDTVHLICGYYGFGIEEWGRSLSYAYDFGPRFLSSENCSKLGIKSLIVFQGMLSPLEDLGEDSRYEQRPDNSILEGVKALLKMVNPGQKVLIYKPGSGAECICLALKRIYVTAFCTSEIEKTALECNAWMNGVDPSFLNIVLDEPYSYLNKNYDVAYSNLPRPVYPHESEVIPGDPSIKRMGFEFVVGKFDREGETTLRFFEIAKKSVPEGKVICVAPNVPSFHEMVIGSGFKIGGVDQNEIKGDLCSMILLPQPADVNKKDDLHELFEESVYNSDRPYVSRIALQRIKKIVSELSNTSIDADIAADRFDYFGGLREQISENVFSYSLIHSLVKTGKLSSLLGFRGDSFQDLVSILDSRLLDLEKLMSETEAFSDPFSAEGIEKIIKTALSISPNREHFFVKTEKLHQFLKINPPKLALQEYEAENLDELIKRIGSVELVFTLCRYVETAEWTAKNFSLYSNLNSEDFEKRPVKISILKDPPPSVVKYFEKKMPFSNDKVAGVLIGVPMPKTDIQKVPRLRAVTRALHYVHEVSFYSSVIGKRLKGMVADHRSLGEALADVLGDNYDMQTFFEPHALVEVMFMEEALRNLEKCGLVGFPKELKNLPFVFSLYDGKEIRVTSLIDRITTLSKGYASELHAKRFLKLSPLLVYLGDMDGVRDFLAGMYTTPNFISSFINHNWFLKNLENDQLKALNKAYEDLVREYIKERDDEIQDRISQSA